MNTIWIESMSSFEMQCITEVLQIDNARLSTKIQSQMDKSNEFYMENLHRSGPRNSPKHLKCIF